MVIICNGGCKMRNIFPNAGKWTWNTKKVQLFPQTVLGYIAADKSRIQARIWYAAHATCSQWDFDLYLLLPKHPHNSFRKWMSDWEASHSAITAQINELLFLHHFACSVTRNVPFFARSEEYAKHHFTNLPEMNGHLFSPNDDTRSTASQLKIRGALFFAPMV